LFEVFRAYGGAIQYKRNRFSALIIHLKFPEATVLLFEVFSMVCAGSHSIILLVLAFQIVRLMVEQFGPRGDMRHIKMDNVVAGADLGFAIDLQALYKRDPNHSKVFPTVFPGLVKNMNKPGEVKLLVFRTGRIVVMGGTSVTMVRNGLQKAYQDIYACRLEGPAPKVKRTTDVAITSKEMENLLLMQMSDEEMAREVDSYAFGKKRMIGFEQEYKDDDAMTDVIKFCHMVLRREAMTEKLLKRLSIAVEDHELMLDDVRAALYKTEDDEDARACLEKLKAAAVEGKKNKKLASTQASRKRAIIN
jgi:TATA-box binding protein (TBP) (component of TFIID and TFIIIB)